MQSMMPSNAIEAWVRDIECANQSKVLIQQQHIDTKWAHIGEQPQDPDKGMREALTNRNPDSPQTARSAGASLSEHGDAVGFTTVLVSTTGSAPASLEGSVGDIVLPEQSVSQADGRSSSERSSASGSSIRFRCPVKHATDLLLAEKPVHFEAAMKKSLPVDLHGVIDDLSDYHDAIGVVPHAVKDELEMLINQSREGKLRQYSVDPSESTSVERTKRDFERLKELYTETKRARFMHVAAWNNMVHYPFLFLALQPFSNLDAHNVTTAPICPEFLLKHASTVLKQSFEGKNVDYTINLRPQNEEVEEAIDRLVADLPLSLRTINQTA